MANLRFSPQFMNAISGFDTSVLEGDPKDPRMGGGGAAGLLTRSLGTAVGRDMRTGKEKIAQAMSEVPADSPNRTALMYKAIIEHSDDPTQKLAASTKLQELAGKQQQQTQLTALRGSLKQRAKLLDLPESMNTTIDNASPEQLKDLTKDLRTQEFNLVNEKRQQPMLDKIAEGYGLAPEDVKSLTFEQITKMGEMGEGTDSKRFEQQNGEVVQLPVRGGKVFYKGPEDTEGKWVTPQIAQVTEEDPNVTTTIQRVETMGKEIDNSILKGFDDNYTGALLIKEQAIENNRALELAGSGVSNTDLLFMKDMMAQDLTLVTTQDVLRLLLLERQILERKESSFDEDLDFMQEIDALDQTRRDYFTKKTRIPEMYKIQEDDIEGIDVSGFDQDTQAFLTEYLNQ